ncbi:MAG: type II toxin-antitoxin system PemK/MazF family toxin [Verrucomicrobia bacterium]|nr:type II toxin-antitoxin system PemK/MazF family toxin [Pseudomonadota bacterium]NBS06874.1 type II toxin-antitoxin system PemK/MazF family toxin [Verrucomicrobiota bacterium]NBS79031.1 type II toxin-antitoxin system PemK/MazF family toxin [bacterium]NBS50562.1 type II toxin-antitoxin system PemK/MazF family toxin [Verrucomicrobiota bacterium]NBT24271.1 type II toxin-antitoxin system PemK/MazF family toxin [bacterium]
MTTEPGQVYLVDLGLAAKIRPMVVVSRKDANAPRALAVCAPMTTASRGSRYEIPVGRPGFLREQSFVNLQGLQSIQYHELKRMIGRLPDKEMQEVRRGLEWVFGLAGAKA